MYHLFDKTILYLLNELSQNPQLLAILINIPHIPIQSISHLQNQTHTQQIDYFETQMNVLLLSLLFILNVILVLSIGNPEYG